MERVNVFFFFFFFFVLQSKRLEVRVIFLFHSQNIHRLTNVTDVMQTVLCTS